MELVLVGICVLGFIWLCWLVAGGRKQITGQVLAAEKALMAGAYADAIRLCDSAFVRGRKMNLPPDDATAMLFVIRSEASEKLGKLDEAFLGAASALACLTACGVQSELTRLSVFDRLGMLLLHMEQDRRAIPVLKAAVALGQVADDDGSRNSARLQHLGLANLRLGAYENSIAAFGRAIEITAKQVGPDHLDLAGSYINLGNGYKQLYKIADAKRCYSEAVRVYAANGIVDQAQCTSALMNLGVACAESGQDGEAQRYYQQVLEIRLKEYGRNDWRVGNVYNNLAGCRMRARDFEAAEKYIQVALEIVDGKPECAAEALDTLSRIREEQGRVEESLAAAVRAVVTLDSQQSPNLSSLAEKLDRQSALAMRLGDEDQASRCRHRAAELRGVLAGGGSESIGAALRNLDNSLEQWLNGIHSNRVTA
jgi:tetratricopeptide (TPR) repeat protein